MLPDLLRRLEKLEKAQERRNAYAAQKIIPWTNYNPIVTGSAGTIGTFAASPYQGRYCVIGSLCFVINKIKITNLGSWSGVIQIALPITPSANLIGDTAGFGWLAPVASNPVTASKGFPNLSTSDSNYRFILSVDAAYASFADIAINYYIKCNFAYEI